MSNLHREATGISDPSERRDVRAGLASGRWWIAAGLLCGGLLMLPSEVRSQSQPAPRTLNQPEDARPIWSPERPGNPTDTDAASASSSSTLRLVREGWGQSRQDSVASTSTNSGVLRWRSRTPAETPAASEDGSIPLTAANGLGMVESPSSVRTVAHQQPADAFQDPFGDRLAQNRDSRYQPAGEAAGDEPSSLLPTLDQLLPPYEGSEPSRPADVVEDPQLPGMDDLPVPAPLPVQPALPESQPALPDFNPAPSRPAPQPPASAAPKAKQPWSSEPTPPLAAPAPSVDSPSVIPGGERSAGDCQRIYNDRDCCKEDEKCEAARLALRQNSIRNISLDITASFKPDAKSAEEESEAAQNQLRRMPSRVWRDRNGSVLAEGRVVNIHNRRIDVQQENGSTKTIALGQLGEDETCFLAAWWQVPTECMLGNEQYTPRVWQPVSFTWKASALCHKPLYFEERMLERYGHTTGPITEPVLSGAHFFLNVAMLPYKVGMNPPNECQYPLGYYRPGSCAPRLLPPVPISPRGALLQAGAVTGMVFVIP